MADEKLVYEVDAADRVARVGDSWEAFARANGSTTLAADQVVGQSLWRFISDLETRYLYELLMKQVRAGRTLRLPLRCDAPDRRRFLLMTLSPLPAGGVLYETVLVRAEPRPPVPLLVAATPRSHALLTMCSWCLRVAVGGLDWAEVEAAVTRLDLFGSLPLPQITHGICPRCEAQVLGAAQAPGQ